MKNIERPFYYGASAEILKRAAILRREMTEDESILWERLRKNKVKGFRFRAQHPIDKFIVDFYCHEALLAIELDGEIHKKEEVAERDEGREIEIKKLGITLVRFKNYEVYDNLDKVVAIILDYLK